jgi:hypothetical protein
VTLLTGEAAMRTDPQADDPHFQDDALNPGMTMPPPGDVPSGGSIPLSKLGRHIEPGPSGKRRHVSTLYRYATRGVRGIRLKTWRFPEGLRTTMRAWYEFVERLTAAASHHPEVKSARSDRAGTKRQNLVEAEIEEVRASIGRKTVKTEKANHGLAPAPPDAKPRWDAVRGELFLGEHLSKRYRQPAANQRLVLDTFEKEGWPSRIEDPLPWGPDTDPRQRLADTARRLNQHNALLRFELDGTSRGLLWEPRGLRGSGT